MNDLKSNGLPPIIAQAIEEMERKVGKSIPLEEINLAELARLTGLTRSKLRTFQHNELAALSGENESVIRRKTKFDGYEDIANALLMDGITNSTIILSRLRERGFTGQISIVKKYVADHKLLVPAKRTIVVPQSSRGRRFYTQPGEAFQMDWGFTKVIAPTGKEYRVACFATICHHCGSAHIEFFPSAKQENLFIGLIHAFTCLGVPEYILTDNMQSVVIRRDIEGHPIWQRDYEAFMDTVGFKTHLCKPRHPFTKGKVERLVRFVKDNFLVGRTFVNLTDLNAAALEWCNAQNCTHRKNLNNAPFNVHTTKCSCNLHKIAMTESLNFYLAPLRKISFDGFINYENQRYGVPYKYKRQVVRVMRIKDNLYIYSDDMKQILTAHKVTWRNKDTLCEGQFEELEQPEEQPTDTVKTYIHQLSQTNTASFDDFDFENRGDDESE